ncbi:MAG: SoxR reducing system RseC family protein [Thermodesulfobacteriota bacterium]|nr:SoxR reducing system RseC family protein [Thermodesulfobacteriota bacterium]
MATERGIVIKIDATTAWVKTTRTSACETCSAKSSCNAVENGKEMEVEAINEAGAQVGDLIIISIGTASLLKASFLLYVFPILLMIAGAVIGQKTGPWLDFDPSLFSAIVGFLFFFISVWFVKSRGNTMARKNEYKPKIIRILKPQ